MAELAGTAPIVEFYYRLWRKAKRTRSKRAKGAATHFLAFTFGITPHPSSEEEEVSINNAY
jgi:hypothetical protein